MGFSRHDVLIYSAFMRRVLVCLGFLWALFHAVGAAASIPLPSVRYASQLWGDGQDLLYVLQVLNEVVMVHECRRGTEPRVLDPSSDWNLKGRAGMVGAGTGDAVQLVVWDEQGRAAWYRGGKWRLAQLPVSPLEGKLECRGVLSAVDGPFYCVTTRGAVVKWQGDAVQRFEPPPGPRTVLSLTATQSGTLYLLDKAPSLLRFENGTFQPMTLPKLQRQGSDSPNDHGGIYWDEKSGELWVGFADRLLIFDPNRGRATLRRLPQPLLDFKYNIGWVGMRGAQARGGAVIWANSYKHKFLCDRSDCYRVPLEKFMYSGFLSASDGIFYAALEENIVAVPMQAAVLGNGRGQPVRGKRNHGPAMGLPFIDVAVGPRWPLPTGDVTVAVDIKVGVRLGFTGNEGPTAPGFWLSPELGYSYAPSTHLFVVGTGLGFGSRRFAIDYTPRFVVGSGPSGTALGGRHGLSFHLLNGLLGVEVAHQYIGEHDMRLMFYINPGLLLVGVFGYYVLGPVLGSPKNLF